MLSLLVTVPQTFAPSIQQGPEYDYGNDSDDDIMDREFEERALNREIQKPGLGFI